MRLTRVTCLAITWAMILTGCELLDPSEPGNLVPLTVMEDDTLPSLQLSGTKLHLERLGPPDGDVIIVLHGGPGDDYRYMQRLNNRVNGRALSDSYQVVFWDQRGSGLSQRHPLEELSVKLYMRDLHELVEFFAPGDQQVIFLAHSWGGQYATAYIDQHPEKVAGAILMEPGDLTKALAAQLKASLDLGLDSEWINDWMWGRQLLSLDDHAQFDYYLSMGSRGAQPIRINEDTSPWWRLGAGVKKALYLDQLADGYDFATDLSGFDAPVLFIAGEADQDLSASFQRLQLPTYPNATLKTLEGAGHTDIVWARVDESLVYIFDYLDELQTLKAVKP